MSRTRHDILCLYNDNVYVYITIWAHVDPHEYPHDMISPCGKWALEDAVGHVAGRGRTVDCWRGHVCLVVGGFHPPGVSQVHGGGHIHVVCSVV